MESRGRWTRLVASDHQKQFQKLINHTFEIKKVAAEEADFWCEKYMQCVTELDAKKRALTYWRDAYADMRADLASSHADYKKHLNRYRRLTAVAIAVAIVAVAYLLLANKNC